MRLLCIVTFYVTVFFPWHIFKLSCIFFLIFWDCLFTIPPSPREVDISMYENSFVKHTDFVKAENSATYKSYPSSSLHHSTLSMIWKDFFFSPKLSHLQRAECLTFALSAHMKDWMVTSRRLSNISRRTWYSCAKASLISSTESHCLSDSRLFSSGLPICLGCWAISSLTCSKTGKLSGWSSSK